MFFRDDFSAPRGARETTLRSTTLGSEIFVGFVGGAVTSSLFFESRNSALIHVPSGASPARRFNSACSLVVRRIVRRFVVCMCIDYH